MPPDESHRIDASENIGVNPSTEPTIDELIERRLSRRSALAQLGVAALANIVAPSRDAAAQTTGPSSLRLREIAHTYDGTHHVAPGYEAQVLIRWGDKVVAGAPAFDASQQSAAAQEKQFGYNCDFIGFHPPPRGSRNSDRGLLCVNSEYSSTNLMFAGLGGGRDANLRATREQAEVEIAAHGMNIVEIARGAGGRWSVAEESRLNRRLTGTTPMTVSGPVAGHDKLKTSADPTGGRVLGTLNNRAGGETPWGTGRGGDVPPRDLRARLAQLLRQLRLGSRRADVDRDRRRADGAPTAARVADGVDAADTEGPGRALTRLFSSAPAGAEVSGITFTPDGTTVFVGVQHPGEDPGSTYENPSTRWPDFENGIPPRPAVVATTKTGGGVIGS